MANAKLTVKNEDYEFFKGRMPLVVVGNSNGEQAIRCFEACQDVVFYYLNKDNNYKPKYRYGYYYLNQVLMECYYRLDSIKNAFRNSGINIDESIINAIFDTSLKKRNHKSMRNLYYGAFYGDKRSFNDFKEIVDRENEFVSIMETFLNSVEEEEDRLRFKKLV